MLEAIEKLLVLQDRDKKISRVEAELSSFGPERAAIETRLERAQTQLDAAKLKTKHIETERKKLELDAEARKQLIDKYSIQQFQTRKNEEYRALAHEIDGCRKAIFELENQQLELMEQAENAQNEVSSATAALNDARRMCDSLVADIAEREALLSHQLADLRANYAELMSAVEESVLTRYQRLRRQKGESAIAGIEHSCCGGCHMKLPVQIVITCQGEKEIVSCPNCGRILYYARHMDLAVAD